MYYLTTKVKNVKIILAEWKGGDNTCCRLAESVFSHYGYSTDFSTGNRVEWKDHVESMKMKKEFSPNFRYFDDSEEKADEYHDLEIIHDYLNMGKTKEYVLHLYPEWEKYFS